MDITNDSLRWRVGVNILPLLKWTARAQHVQTKPKFCVKLHVSGSTRSMLQCLDPILRPLEKTLSPHIRIFASVDATLLRMTRRRQVLFPALVLKSGTGAIDLESARQDLLRNLDFQSDIDMWACLGYYGQRKQVTGLVDVLVTEDRGCARGPLAFIRRRKSPELDPGAALRTYR